MKNHVYLDLLPGPSKTSQSGAKAAPSVPQASKMPPKWSPNGALEGIKKCLRRHLGQKSADPHSDPLFAWFRKGLTLSQTLVFYDLGYQKWSKK